MAPKVRGKGTKTHTVPYAPGHKHDESKVRSKRACGIEPSTEWLAKQVNETIASVFASFSAREIDHELVNGLSLRQALTQDKRTWCLTGSPALSPEYYQEKKKAYRQSHRSTDDLRVREEHESNKKDVSNKLLSALALLKLKSPNRIGLCQWLSTVPSVSQKALGAQWSCSSVKCTLYLTESTAFCT